MQTQVNFSGNDMWMPTSEAAKILNLSDRSVRRKAKQGIYQFKYDFASKKKNTTKQMLIFIPEDLIESQRTPADMDFPADIPADTSGHDVKGSFKNKLDTFKSIPADKNDHFSKSENFPADTSGHNFTSAKPACTPAPADTSGHEKRNYDSARPVYTKALTIKQITTAFNFRNEAQAYRHARKRSFPITYQTLPGGGRRKLYIVPVDEFKSGKISMPQLTTHDSPFTIDTSNVPALTPAANRSVPEHELHLAALRAELCIYINNVLEQTPFKEKAIAWQNITDEYNAGNRFPDLYNNEGTKTIRALQNWLTKYKKGGNDALIKKYHGGKSTVSSIELDFLLALLLDTNRIKIGSAIKELKRAARENRLVSNSSERTLRNYINNWADENRLIWNQARQGTKYVKDVLRPSILRDQDALKVGQLLCADGHIVSFDIIDPLSGKAKRMMWIVYLDWASRYPVGASFATTEDSAHILSAFRAAVINLQAAPDFVYLDNGRAFKDALFHGKGDQHDLTRELSGVYPRLGVGVKFAQAYNARAKGPIERFFRTVQDGFERFMETFRGCDIADKPAYLMRNEKWAQAIRDRKPLTMDQAKALMNYYIKNVYGMTPHAGLNGKKPYEVFKAGLAEIPVEKRVKDISKLNYLMLKVDQRKVTKEGIRFNNAMYYSDDLLRYVKDSVIIRYDLLDVRSVLVYDSKDRFLTQAYLRKVAHPFVDLATDDPLAAKQLKKQIDHQRKTESTIKKLTREQTRKSQRAVDQLPQPVIPQIEKASSFDDTPMIPNQQPKPKADPIEALGAESSSSSNSDSRLTTHDSRKKSSKFQNRLKDMGLI